MKPSRILKNGELAFKNLPLAATSDNVELAATFAFSKWRERWAQRKSEWESTISSPFTDPEPDDLSGSCKFTSVFAAVIFDYGIDGNYDHQFAVKKGHVIDLNSGASDVGSLAQPYRLDPLFFGSKDHLASMKSCVPRIMEWLREFDASLDLKPDGVPRPT